VIDAVLHTADAMGLSVVRCWAFNDGPNRPMALQPAPYIYPDRSFDSLDYTVFRAGELGLKLVLPLVNNWPDFGGMQQYVAWHLGLPDDSYGGGLHHDLFYTAPSIRACFLAYIEHVIGRVNPYTGLRYGEDSTIMTWELANEPRNRSDNSGRGLREWADVVSTNIKSMARRQLVAVGDEGFGLPEPADKGYPYRTDEGNRWVELTSLRAVDYGTVHLYPQNWNQSSAFGVNPVDWGKQWITDHAVLGRLIGKPVVLEEFGLRVDAANGVASSVARDRAYEEWLMSAENARFAGTQFWMLAGVTQASRTPSSDDGFQVVYPSSTASVISRHALNIRMPS
jgi:mannan endo-1,4-beta-mannosidase